MDLTGVLFNLLFTNPSEAIEYWNKVKIQHIQEGYLDIYGVVSNYYDKNFSIPSFEEIKLHTRSAKIHSKIVSIEQLTIEDVSISVVVDSLIDQHIQNEALTQIESLVKNITLLDSEEIKLEFNSISISLEEHSPNNSIVSNMSDLLVTNSEELCLEQTFCGINEYIDTEVKLLTTELIMLGGKRGSGKSIVVNNMFVNQYKQGNVGLLFSIEMRKQEIFNRTLSMLSGVNSSNIRNGNITAEEYIKLAEVRKDMFLDSDSIFEKFLETKNFRGFELELIKHKKLKEDNQLIIIDNQKLTLSDIDAVLTKQKAIFGNKLRTCQVDYVNQIHLESDQYDWKAQITLSKRLKDLARKHDISIITPYQIDDSNEARFSKGLLDAADIAMVLDVEDNCINFNSTKIRSGSHFKTKSNINWNSLLIDPTQVTEVKLDNIQKAKGVNDL